MSATQSAAADSDAELGDAGARDVFDAVVDVREAPDRVLA